MDLLLTPHRNGSAPVANPSSAATLERQERFGANSESNDEAAQAAQAAAEAEAQAQAAKAAAEAEAQAQAAKAAAETLLKTLIAKPVLAQSPAEQAVIDKINILYSFDNYDDFLGELKADDDRKADVIKTFKEEKYFKDFCTDMITENNEDESYFIFLDTLLRDCLDSDNLLKILPKGNIVQNFELLLTVMKSAKYDKYLFNTIYRLVPTLENKFELPDYELDNNLKKAHIYWLLKFMNLI